MDGHELINGYKDLSQMVVFGLSWRIQLTSVTNIINLLNAELNLICHLLTLLGAHHILHVSRIRVKQHHRPTV